VTFHLQTNSVPQRNGMNDLLMACHACSLGLTLVTEDTRT